MEDTADSEAVMDDVEESTTDVSEKRKEKTEKPKRPCLFCGKIILKLPLHLKRKHYMEERVKVALKLPKSLRDRAFERIRKDGIYLANKKIMMKTDLSDREKEQQFLRERRCGSKDLVMCSICHGFYGPHRIHRHERLCCKVEGIQRTNIPPAIPASLVFEENGSENLKEDQVVLTASEPVLKSVSNSTTDISEKRKKRTMKPKHPCLFCGKFLLTLTMHLRRKHYMEERVKTAMNLPKRLQDRSFNKIIRDGCLLANKKIMMKTDPGDNENEQQFLRERRHAELNYVMCSCCHGFYSPLVIQRHKQSCSPPKTSIAFEEVTEGPVLETVSTAERRTEATTDIPEASPISSAIEEEVTDELKKDHFVLTDSELVMENVTLSTTKISGEVTMNIPALSPVTSAIEKKMTNELKGDHFVLTGSEPVMENVTLSTTNTAVEVTTNISKESPVSSAVEEGRSNELKEDHLVLADTEPLLETITLSTTNISENGKNQNRKKLKRPCLFCGKLQSKLLIHLRRKHPMEERVRAALKLPRSLRDRAFERMRKDGIYLANKKIMMKTDLSDHEKEKQFISERRHVSKDLVMCSGCHGFYKSQLIQKHQQTCSSTEGTKNPVAIPVLSAFEGEEPIVEESGTYENGKEPKEPCLFCGEMQSKLIIHLKRKHHMEERVKAALKLPKCLRDREFKAIRKDGIYLANKNLMKTSVSDYEKKQQFMRDRRHGKKDLVMCSGYRGFYSPRLIQKHQRSCSSTEGTKNIPVSLPVPSEIERERSNVEKNGTNENRMKPKRPCLFCGKLQSKLVIHLKRKHPMEERVRAALKLPKSLRDRAFERIRKDGIFLANKKIMMKTDLSDHEKEKQFISERRHCSKDLVMCSGCHGFYKSQLIQKHQRTCSSTEGTKSIPVAIPVLSAFEGEGPNVEESGTNENGKEPKEPCLFCGEMQSKLIIHLKRKHAMEERVKAALKLSKSLRDREFEAIRKDGIYLSNKNITMKNNISEKEQQFMRERRHGNKDLVICSGCHGLYNPGLIQKHQQACSSAERTKHIPVSLRVSSAFERQGSNDTNVSSAYEGIGSDEVTEHQLVLRRLIEVISDI